MIRLAEKKDVPALKKLLEEVLYIHHVGRPDIFKAKGQKYTDEQLAALVLVKENPIFVYEDENGEVIGHCMCQTIDRAEAPNAYAYKTLFIDDLCIEEKARGKHVGKAMYEYVKAYAKENGYYNITLHAWECNPEGVGFYKHLGMEIQQYTMEELL